MRNGILCVVLGVVLISGVAGAATTDTEPNNDASTAQPIALGSSVGGSLYYSGDVDWFSFDGEAGMQVRIELFHTGSFLGTTDFALYLYSPSLTLLGWRNTPPSGGTIDYEKVEATLSTTGTHYIRVSKSVWASIANGYSVATTWLNQPTPTPTPTETPTPTWTPIIPETGVDGWEIYR